MADLPKELSNIFEQKLKVYDEFLCSTDSLLGAIERDDITAVENYLRRREELIGIIGDIDRRIDNYRKKNLFDHYGTIPESLLHISEEIRNKLERIVSANRDCRDVTVGKLEMTRKDLIALRQTKKGIQKYAPKAERIPKFLNVQT